MAAALDQLTSSRAKGIYLKVGVPILVLVAAAITFGAWWLNQTVQVEDIRKLEWRELKSSELVLKAGDSLQATWLGGLYVSDSALDKVIRLQEGTVLKVIGMDKFEDLVVEVSGFKVVSKDGPPMVDVDLHAKSEKSKLSLSIKAKALLGYKRTTPKVGDKEAQAYFGLSVTELQPRLTWSGISLAVPGFMRTLSASGLMKAIGDSLEFPVPLAKALDIPLGLPKKDDRPPNAEREFTIPIKDTGGFVKMKAVYANTDLTYALTFATPLFTRSGIWILADDKPYVPPTVSDALPSDEEFKALSDAVNAKRNAIPVPKGDVAVFINQRSMISLVRQIQQLPVEKRTVVLRSIAYDKQIYNKPWRDDVLGEGGFFIEARKPDFASAMVVIDVPTVAWAPSKGVQISGSANATAAADLHWHFRATGFLGGGVGKDLNIVGKGSVGVNGLLGISMIRLGGKPIAVFTPTMNCVNVPIEAEEGGELHFKVKTSIPMFEKPLGVALALDTIPRNLPFVDKDKKAVEPVAGKILLDPQWKNPALDVTVSPVEATTTESGFWIVADLVATVASPDRDAYKGARELLAKQIAEYSDALPKSVCPEADGLRVTIIGIEIGPNGELIKLFQAGGQLVKNITTAAQKALDDINKQVKQVADEAARIANQAKVDAQNGINWVGDRLGIHW